MSLTIFDREFINYWKSLNFDNWNEPDVREEFIAPLLKILGYAKGTIDDISREESLELAEKYHRIGRKKIEIDYVPKIRLKKFWIIEAKPGHPRKMNFGDFLQAHFYAIHPEVNVRLIVVTNGWEIRIYDAMSAGDWDDFIIKVHQENCEETFTQLKELLSSKSLTKAIRKRILSAIEETLKIAIDENEADELRNEVSRIYQNSLPIIRKNAHEFKISSWRKNQEESDIWIKSISWDELLIWMDRPTDSIPWYAEECVRRIKNADQPERNEMIGKLAMSYRGRPHGVFRVQCLHVMCRLLEAGIEASKKGYASSVINCLEELVKANLEYWSWPVGDKIDHIGFALCHLDNTCLRISYKFCRRFPMEIFAQIVQSKNEIFSAEDLLLNKPTVARQVVDSVRFINEMIWSRVNGYDSKQIWSHIWNLQFIEKAMDEMPPVPYQDGDMDILNFDHYGIDFDMYCVGTWTVLQSFKKIILESKASVSVKAMLEMNRDSIISDIPEPLAKPENWEYNLSIPVDDLKRFWNGGVKK